MRRFVAALGTASLLLTAGCGGGSSTPHPTVPVTTSSSTPVMTSTTNPSASYTASAFVCPSADSTTAVATGGREGSQMARRMPATGGRSVASLSSATTTRLAVSYALSASSAARSALAARVSGSGGTSTRTLSFNNIGLETQIVSVPTTQAAAAEAALRAQAGVKFVAVAGGRRLPLAVNAPTYTNDPYFQGFQNPVPPTSGASTPASTFEVQPLVESANVPGQWEMHVTQIDRAFSYASSNAQINGSGIVNGGALGSTSVKIAIIDTGMDTAHPELSGKIVRQRCFITNPSGTQSTSDFVTDPDGHGTDVTGLAAATANNNLGFAGAGGASLVYGYRVQPTPDDNCTPGSTTAANDPQCSADTIDVAAAINDAVASGANVISMSLGGGACTSSGADPDPTEGQAVANAIAANVVVVAAAGNDGTSPVGAPACDPGVIAVGASAIADGQTNGAGNTNGSASAPTEYVASYSDYGSTTSAVGSASAWGIVAPGGDPAAGETSSATVDDLHWIENIWTSTPYMSSASDTKFEGTCASDYPNDSVTSGTIDCRTLIAGTSMSTPIVAGTAALIIAANPAYQSASKMKALLCSTADDIGDSKEGCGRLNAYRAMAQALGDSNPPPAAPLPQAVRRATTAG